LLSSCPWPIGTWIHPPLRAHVQTSHPALEQ
jgi:hypothetical protein